MDDPTTQVVAVAVTLLAGSEILAMLPIRSNSWFQLVVAVLRGIVSTKKPPTKR